MKKSNSVPKSLRIWFIIHFFADIIFAVPLILFPVWFMTQLGWSPIDPVTLRLVGAALVGIGVESWLGRHASLESFRTMLRLKVLWSVSANVGIALSLYQGAPPAAWLFQGIFLGFSSLWIYYALRLKA